ncbi:MAG TPA: class I SAM-dependent methyltransferase, partial [Phycisphaerales bacterium]|nr:class I SAM-dependent methyltransferase [Phycisphaerales bacterium]
MPSKPPRQRPGGRPPRRPGGRTAPRRAAPLPEPDRHDLYQRAVQCVEAEIDFVDATFRRRRGRRAVLLREDFCGTANTSCEWVRRRRENRAVGVDLDAPTLAWGIRHNLARLDAEQRTRVTLLRQDVLEARRPPRAPGYDVVLAMNFSYWIFKERERMRRYFTAVRRSLAPDGLFFLDHYAGSEVHTVTTERRAIRTRPRFTYIWDQASLNPITNEM